jgi:hypothetical protein
VGARIPYFEIDPGMRWVVVAFNEMLGIPTSESCQGHFCYREFGDRKNWAKHSILFINIDDAEWARLAKFLERAYFVRHADEDNGFEEISYINNFAGGYIIFRRTVGWNYIYYTIFVGRGNITKNMLRAQSRPEDLVVMPRTNALGWKGVRDAGWTSSSAY